MGIIAAHPPTPCLGRSADGRLELFIVGVAEADGRPAVWHKWQTAPSNGWSGWHSEGSPPGVRHQWNGPVVASNKDGRLELFLTYFGELWHKWQTVPNNGWSGWDSLGKAPRGRNPNVIGVPAVHPNADGRLEVFLTGADSSLWQLWQTAPSNGWSDWDPEIENAWGMTLRTVLAANADGCLNWFQDSGIPDGVRHRWQTAPSNGWSDGEYWEFPPGNEFVGQRAAVAANADGRLEYFVVGIDGALWHKWQTAPNKGWSAWASLRTPPGLKLKPFGPAVAASADGRLELFVVAEDGELWHKWQTAPSNGWSNWASHGRPPAAPGKPPVDVLGVPAIAPSADGRLELFVVGSDNALWHSWQTAPGNGWSRWWSHGAPAGFRLAKSQTRVTSIRVGDYPFGAAINPAGSRVYVGIMKYDGPGTVSVVDTATNSVVTTVPVGHSPQQMAVTSNGTRLYVVTSNGTTGEGEVSVIDTANNTVVKKIAVSKFPGHIAISRDDRRAYVTRSGGVSIIDTASNTVVGEIVSVSSPGPLAISGDGKRLYIAHDKGLSVVDTADGTLVTTVTMTTEAGVSSLAVSPTGSHVYMVLPIEGVVAVINTASYTVESTIPTIYGAAGLAVTRDGKRAIVTHPGNFYGGRLPWTDDSVSVLDTATKAIVATIDVPRGPYFAVLSPDGAKAYVTTVNDGTLSVIQMR